MMKNGKTWQLASIAFLCKINTGVIEYDTVAGLLNNIEELKEVLKKCGQMEHLIKNHVQNEADLFYQIFSIIGEEVLGYCFSDALYVAEEQQKNSSTFKLPKTRY